MKKLLIVPVLLLSSITFAQECKVIGVSDGDTLTCLTGNKQQIKVRMNQIDAPESRQAYGTAAKNKLSGMVFGKQIILKIDGTDKYKRTLAQVFIDSTNVNKEMVRTGYAWAYRQYVTDQEYIRLENNARAAKQGLWADAYPINPSDFRRGVRNGVYTAPTTQQTPIIKKQTNSNLSCGSKRTCGEMSSCAEARHYLNACGLSRLDRDNDGVPCESICR